MKKFALIAMFSFLGGMTGSLVFSSSLSWAAKEETVYTTNFLNNQNRRVGVLGSHASGEGTFYLFNGNSGEIEIQMGAYTTGAEKGQTLIGMHDRNGKLRHLTRMHGANDSPTVIMKDKSGRDRIVFGLDPNTQAPYFRYVDSNGKLNQLF